MKDVHREHREWMGELPTMGEGRKRKFAVGDVVRAKRRGWLFRITRAQGWLDDGTPYYNVEGITHPELKGFLSEDSITTVEAETLYELVTRLLP